MDYNRPGVSANSGGSSSNVRLSPDEYFILFPPKDHRKSDEIILRARLMGRLSSRPLTNTDYEEMWNIAKKYSECQMQSLADTLLFTAEELEEFEKEMWRDYYLIDLK